MFPNAFRCRPASTYQEPTADPWSGSPLVVGVGSGCASRRADERRHHPGDPHPARSSRLPRGHSGVPAHRQATPLLVVRDRPGWRCRLAVGEAPRRGPSSSGPCHLPPRPGAYRDRARLGHQLGICSSGTTSTTAMNRTVFHSWAGVHRVGVNGLRPRHRMAFAIARDRHRDPCILVVAGVGEHRASSAR